jgi:uncharacterized protein (TIGR03083 family)
MVAVKLEQTVVDAGCIPYVTADEALALLQTEVGRFLTLLDSLKPNDWAKPTACTAWAVRDIVAHQAGGYASGTSYRELIHQYLMRPKVGQLPEDAVNELQLAERAEKSPAQLMEELREVAPIAMHKWAYEFRLFKRLGIPHPVPGWLSMRDLMWVIHSRDTWMHRLDICRATGHVFEQTTGHDDRIIALVVRDVAKTLRRKLHTHPIILDLSGVAGGVWRIGMGQPMARIQMDALDFNIYASGRYSYDQARARANVSGDVALAELALKNTQALY